MCPKNQSRFTPSSGINFFVHPEGQTASFNTNFSLAGIKWLGSTGTYK